LVWAGFGGKGCIKGLLGWRVFSAPLQDFLELLESYAWKLLLLALHVFLVFFAELHVFQWRTNDSTKWRGGLRKNVTRFKVYEELESKFGLSLWRLSPHYIRTLPSLAVWRVRINLRKHTCWLSQGEKVKYQITLSPLMRHYHKPSLKTRDLGTLQYKYILKWLVILPKSKHDNDDVQTWHERGSDRYESWEILQQSVTFSTKKDSPTPLLRDEQKKKEKRWPTLHFWCATANTVYVSSTTQCGPLQNPSNLLLL